MREDDEALKEIMEVDISWFEELPKTGTTTRENDLTGLFPSHPSYKTMRPKEVERFTWTGHAKPPSAVADSWVDEPETETCPECGEEFHPGDGIDGDDGTKFCSLKCLNEHVNP